MSLVSSRLAGSLLLKDNDHMHTDHCHTHDILLSSLSPMCIPRLAAFLYTKHKYMECV